MSRTLQRSAFTLITLLIIPVFVNAQEPSQAEINYIQSWSFESEVTQAPRVACRPIESKEELAKQNAEWKDLWSDIDSACSRAECKGTNCDQVCDNKNCMNGKLGTLGMISESCGCDTCEPCEKASSPIQVSTDSVDCNTNCAAGTCKITTCCSTSSGSTSYDCSANSKCSTDSCCGQSNCCTQSECENCSMCTSYVSACECPQSCTDIVEMLCMTLENGSMNNATTRKAVSHALTLAFNNGKADSASAMEQLKLKHANEMAVLRGKSLQMSTQIRTVDDIRNWMEPLYTNQNRANHQMQLMGASTSALHRTLSLLEKQLSTLQNSRTPARKFTNPHVTDSPRSDDVYDLQRQVSQLKQQLRSLQQSKSASVQPAQHLQPISNPKYSLEPIESPYPAIDWPAETRRR